MTSPFRIPGQRINAVVSPESSKPAVHGVHDLLCSVPTVVAHPTVTHPTTSACKKRLHQSSDGCSCKRSKCIKLYCDCFASSRHCTASCSCMNCENTLQHKQKAANDSGKRNMKPSVIKSQGCSCVKSQCLKRYCECFRSGQLCTRSCTCVQCENGKTCISDLPNNLQNMQSDLSLFDNFDWSTVMSTAT